MWVVTFGVYLPDRDQMFAVRENLLSNGMMQPIPEDNLRGEMTSLTGKSVWKYLYRGVDLFKWQKSNIEIWYPWVFDGVDLKDRCTIHYQEAPLSGTGGQKYDKVSSVFIEPEAALEDPHYLWVPTIRAGADRVNNPHLKVAAVLLWDTSAHRSCAAELGASFHEFTVVHARCATLNNGTKIGGQQWNVEGSSIFALFRRIMTMQQDFKSNVDR